MKLDILERPNTNRLMKTRLIPITIAAITLVFAGCASPPDCKTPHEPKQRQQQFAANAAFGGPKHGFITVADPVPWSNGGPSVGAVVCRVIGPLYGTQWRPYKKYGHVPTDNELITPSEFITIPCDASSSTTKWRARIIANPPASITSPERFFVEGGKKTVITISYY